MHALSLIFSDLFDRIHILQVNDIYSTGEPQSAFHARIAFCLDLHNEAVKAMRYEVNRIILSMRSVA